MLIKNVSYRHLLFSTDTNGQTKAFKGMGHEQCTGLSLSMTQSVMSCYEVSSRPINGQLKNQEKLTALNTALLRNLTFNLSVVSSRSASPALVSVFFINRRDHNSSSPFIYNGKSDPYLDLSPGSLVSTCTAMGSSRKRNV